MVTGQRIAEAAICKLPSDIPRQLWILFSIQTS
ncbi:hypothetical protein JMJ77_0012734 [Colletotrichum scovillei]|uniref:Uncharacterized protein n=1 Tax=Colletotrichum scovillei TaxID=1209932 RepID=A0A9P7R7G8_9PEZI|nr:hypothetical protein JMJ77_0012734 [Colletotrichum scovillei]KAG7072967.1 hypothetical protein JMJ78_0013952 [Colletotrichum scovillei]